MSIRTRLITAALSFSAALWLLPVFHLPAQDGELPTIKAGSATGFDIVIEDGFLLNNGDAVEATLENVVDFLRDIHPQANIVVAPEVPSIRIKDLKIRAADLRMELEAVRAASGNRFVWDTSGDLPANAASGVAPDARRFLYVLRRTPEPAHRLQIEAFSLTGYFKSLPQHGDGDEQAAFIRSKLEELERMVDETAAIYWELDDSPYPDSASRRLSMRFHPGANLLVLIGDARSIEVASKVVGALPDVHRSGGYVPTANPFGNAYGAARVTSFGPGVNAPPQATPTQPLARQPADPYGAAPQPTAPARR